MLLSEVFSRERSEEFSGGLAAAWTVVVAVGVAVGVTAVLATVLAAVLTVIFPVFTATSKDSIGADFVCLARAGVKSAAGLAGSLPEGLAGGLVAGLPAACCCAFGCFFLDLSFGLFSFNGLLLPEGCACFFFGCLPGSPECLPGSMVAFCALRGGLFAFGNFPGRDSRISFARARSSAIGSTGFIEISVKDRGMRGSQ